MKKKIIIAGVAGVTLIAGLVWFLLGRLGKESYCSAIPKDALMVARFAPVEFMEKNNLEVKDLTDRLGLQDRLGQNIEDFLKSGVDVTQPVYLFMDEGNSLSFGVVFCLDNAGSFEEYLESNGTKVRKDKGLYWADNDSFSCLCFDDDKALLYAVTSGSVDNNHVRKLMEQDEKKSILGTKMFQQLTDCGKCLAMNMNTTSMNSLMREYMTGEEGLSAFSAVSMVLPDCNVLVAVDAEDDELKLTADMFPNSEQAEKDMQLLLGQYPSIQGSLTGTGLENPLAWMCFNFQGQKILDMAKGTMLDNALRQADEAFGLSDALGSFDGDVTLSLDKGLGERPSFLMLAEVKDDNYVSSLKKLVGQTGADFHLVHEGGSNFHLTQTLREASAPVGALADDDDDEWGYDFDDIDEYTDDDFDAQEREVVPARALGEETMAYLGRQGNCCVLTNNPALMQKAGAQTQALRDIQDDVKGCLFYMYVDTQAMSHEFQGGYSTAPSRMVGDLLGRVLGSFSRLTVFSKDRHAEMTLKTKDGQKITELIFGNEVID